MKEINPKPFLKWVGGKGQLLEQFKNLFPKKYNKYYEPFVGGGAVFFYLKPESGHINDINEVLINTYKIIKTKPHDLIELLRDLEDKFHKSKDENKKEFYYDIREKFNDIKKPNLQKSAYLIFLNKTCFNGMYRENSKGGFNVPFGQYKNPTILNESNILEVSKLLKHIEITNTSFEECLENAEKGDFIYFDPPYYPLNKTSSFTTYSKDNFLEKEQEKLASLFKKLDKKGCYVMLSNSNTEFIEKLYKGYNIKKIYANRMINSVSSKRGKILEIVVRNYE